MSAPLLNSIKPLIKNIACRPTWDEYFMSLALLTSSRSSCKRLNVGCVLVKDNYILSTGYNGFISGAKHESIIRNDHEQAIIHAEQNAIAHCAKRGISLDNTIAYITHYPCINCFKMLISSGIKHIIYSEDYKNDEIVSRLSNENNIKITKIN